MILQSQLTDVDGVREMYQYQEFLKEELKKVDKEVDAIENEVLKLAQGKKEGYISFLDGNFKITIKPKYKITDEEKAFPYLKKECSGLVKEAVNYMSLQSNVKDMNKEVLSKNGIGVIDEVKLKLV